MSVNGPRKRKPHLQRGGAYERHGVHAHVSNGDGARATGQASQSRPHRHGGAAVAHVTRSACWREICQMRARQRMRGVISPLYPPPRAHDAGRDNAGIRGPYDRQGHHAPPASAGPARQPREGPAVSAFYYAGRDRKPLHLSNHRWPGPTTFASPCRMFPSRPPHPPPLLTAHRRRRALALPRSSP